MKVHGRLLAIAIVWLAAPLPRALSLQDQTGSFVLSVLRRDGIVIPFAAFDGRRWSSRWPDYLPRERPISLENIPKEWWGVERPSARMHLWSDGVRVGDVMVQGPTITPLMCAPRMTLKSDYKSAHPVPPRFELPFPKDGVLVSAAAPLAKIDSVDPASPEAQTVLGLATDAFNRQENVAATAFTDWRHPIKPDERKRVPVTVEALYRTSTDDPAWTAYFIEGVRQYPPRAEDKDGCGLATYASGWVVTGPERPHVQLRAQVTYCDRKGVGYMLPFGSVLAGGKKYWVFQYSGFEVESYEVVRPHRRGVEGAVAYPAGACVQ